VGRVMTVCGNSSFGRVWALKRATISRQVSAGPAVIDLDLLHFIDAVAIRGQLCPRRVVEVRVEIRRTQGRMGSSQAHQKVYQSSNDVPSASMRCVQVSGLDCTRLNSGGAFVSSSQRYSYCPHFWPLCSSTLGFLDSIVAPVAPALREPRDSMRFSLANVDNKTL
jgi:hypothetical protein